MFEQLCKAKLPGVNICNRVDDSLIQDVIAHGCLRPPTAKRVIQLVAAAGDARNDSRSGAALCRRKGQGYQTHHAAL